MHLVLSNTRIIETSWIRKYLYSKPWFHQLLNTITKNRITIYNQKRPIQYIKARKYYKKRLRLKKSHLLLKTDRLTPYVNLNYYLFKKMNYQKLIKSILYNYSKYPIYKGSIKHLNKDFIIFLKMVLLHTKRGVLRKRKLFKKRYLSFRKDSDVLYLLRWISRRHLRRFITKKQMKKWVRQNKTKAAHFYRFRTILGRLRLDLRMATLAMFNPKLFQATYKDDLLKLKKNRERFIKYLAHDIYGIQKIGLHYFPYILPSIRKIYMKYDDFIRRIKRKLKKRNKKKHIRPNHAKLYKKNILAINPYSLNILK